MLVLNLSEMRYERAEIHLGEKATDALVHNLLGAIGYRPIEQRSLAGQSGICHDFQCIAVRENKVLLVVGGAEKSETHNYRNNAARSDAWVRGSLTKYYDVAEALRAAGYKTNALLFQNVNDQLPAEILIELIRKDKKGAQWARDLGIPDDSSVSLTRSIDPLPSFFNVEVMNVAQNMGFPYFSLTDVDYKVLHALTHKSDAGMKHTAEIIRKQGLDRYFFPPADEFVLSCVDRGKFKAGDERFKDLFGLVEESGVEIQNSLHIQDITLRDPLAIAKELEKSKTIQFESEITITEKGRSIRQKISTTPQESLITRVLKCVSLKSVISLTIGGGGGKS